MAEYYYDKGIRKKVKEGYTISSKGTIVKASKKKKKKDDDIAPVKKTTGGNKNSWFKSGGFSDGVDGIGDFFGDLAQTTVGTIGDIGVGVGKGITRLGEGVVDLGTYGVAKVADLAGKDKWAEKTKKKAQKDWTSKAWKKAENAVDKYSVLGNKADNVTEGLGTVAGILATGGVAGALGAGSGVATAITTGVTGLSGMGSGMSEAYQNKATDKEAFTYGAIAGTAEAATELLFGGLGKTVKALGISKGLSSADDMLAKKITSKFTNQIAKNFTEFGIKAGAEGTEEVLSGIAQAVGKKVTYMEEKELEEILKDENLLDQFIVGSITSGIAQSGYIPGMKQGSLREANKSNTDFITGLTQNEQKVVDKEYENRITEAEEGGKTLSKKEKNKIYDEVINDLEKGYISTDTIEGALGGETYKTYKSMEERENEVRKEIEELEKTPYNQFTVKQHEKLTSLREQLATMEKSGLKNKVRNQLNSEVSELAMASKLSESYNEKTRRGQAFQADLTKYDAKQQDVIKKATESGILNNTNRTHEFVDMVAKISADKGVSFDFTNNQKLKDSGFAVEGKTVNGYVKDGNIAVNIDSNKSLNSVVGHEITHVLEGTELYTELQNAVKEYATTKGEYDTRFNELSELYKDVEGSNIESELTADLVGDYLFTDKDFINNLSTKKPNIFKRIYDEIKYLCKIATAGSKEARQLEKVKRAFDKAYQESNKANTDTDSDVKYSFAGTRAKNSNSSLFLKAEAMLDRGVDSETVRKETGWHKGYDGRMRYEIDDSKAKVHSFGDANFRKENPEYAELQDLYDKWNNNTLTSEDEARMDELEEVWGDEPRTLRDNLMSGESTLKDILEHDELFESYPQLATIQIGVEKLEDGTQGMYLRDENKIILDESMLNISNEEQLKKTLMHEIQHAIQHEEGFARGSSPEFYESRIDEIAHIIRGAKENLDLWLDDIGYKEFVTSSVKELKNGKSIEQHFKDLEEFKQNSKYAKQIKLCEDEMKQFQKMYTDYTQGMSSGDMYYNTAGEIEARDTEERLSLDIEQRKATRPNIDKENVVFAEGKTKYSLSDSNGKELTTDKEYMSAVEKGDTETAQKIVDEVALKKGARTFPNGKLIKYYHGTSADFTSFDIEKARQGIYGFGFYFSPMKEKAQGYQGENGKLISGYIFTDKLATMKDHNLKADDVEKILNDFNVPIEEQEWLWHGYDSIEDWLKEESDRIALQEIEKRIYYNSEAPVSEILNALRNTLGYDGIQAGNETILFDNKLIKSAEAITYDDEDNVIPLSKRFNANEEDIRYSLSDKNKQYAPIGKYNVYGKDVALEKDILSTVQEKTNVVQDDIQDDIAPTQEVEEETTDDDFEKIVQSYIDNAPLFLDDDEVRPWAEWQARENPQGPVQTQEEELVIPESPLADRDIDTIGRQRKTNAYMYENPEVKPFFQDEALAMLLELQFSTPGERHALGPTQGLKDYDAAYEGSWGTKRDTSEDLAYLRDTFKYDKNDLLKGLNAIIEDDGAENNAISKRIEFVLDKRLRKGYNDFMNNGKRKEPNQNYINLLNEKQITEYNDEARSKYFQPEVETVDTIAETTETVQDIAPVKEIAAEPVTTINENVQPQVSEKQVTSKLDNGAKQRKWIKTSTESKPVDKKILPKDLDQKAITYEPIPNKNTLNNANSMLKRNGYDESVKYFNSQFQNKKISLDDIALGERLIQEAVKKGDMETAGELIQNVSILGTELGQKVQALSIIQRLTPEGQLKTLTKIVERGKAKGDKTFEGVEITQEMIDKVLKTYHKDGTYSQEELDRAVEEVKQQIADQMKVTKMDKINAWRYLSMLGNPKTHVRNIISNVGMKGTMAVKDAIARSIETVAPIETRTKTWKKTSNDVKEFAKQTTKEMQSILEDGGKYSDTNDIKSKRQIFKNKVLNAVFEFNSDMLSKEDWWFQGAAFNKAFSEYLTANGINTKEDIQNNAELIEKAKAYATEQSEIATFKQYSYIAHKLNEIESKNTATQIGVGAIVPFKKTPVNIAKTGLNYSPLGFMKTLTYDASQVKKGNMEASQMIDHLAQNMTGTGLALAGYMLAMSGFLNGAGEEDKEGKYDYQLGKQSYSVNIGGNTYSLSWLTPMAMPLFVGANAFEILTEGKEWDGNVVIESLTQTLDPMSEMSVLSGLTNVLSSYEKGSGIWADIAQTAGQNYVTQFVPTLSSQVATLMDDKQRSTKVAGNSDFKYLEETVNKLKLKIPGLRETLEPSTDVWGREVKLNENKWQKTFDTFLAPYSRKENIATQIDEELKDLYSDTGDGGLFPQTPKNSVNYEGEKYNMSAKEYTSFKKTYGQNALELMEELFQTMTYQNATATDKAEMVDKVYDYANDEAKRKYLAKKDIEFTNAKKDGEPYYKENIIKGAIENDMPLMEFDFYNEYPEKYNFLQKNNVSYKEYSKDEDTREAYNWAFNNQEKYTVSKVISDDLVAYKKLTQEIYKFRADKDSNGKTINGTAKAKKINYINNLDMEYGKKLVLFKSLFDKDDTYNYEIIDYLNSREDITYEETETILKQLGFTVAANGNIYWD